MILQNEEVRFEVTNKCNARCIMCPREKMNRPQGIMDWDLYKKIIDQISVFGAKVVSLENYGETFLDPFIFKRAEYAKKKGLQTFTITNGSMLTKNNCELIDQFFDKIRISLYGVTRETYEKIHRGLIFEQTMSGLEKLFKAKKNVRIEIYFLLMRENEHEVERFIRIYKDRCFIGVWKPHNWIDGRGYRNMLGEKKSCKRPMKGPFQVQWDGKVVACCFDYDSKIILGDLNTESVEEVLKGDRYNRLREAHNKEDFRDYICDGCDQLIKRDDVLVYTNIDNAKVGATNTLQFNLEQK